MTTSKHGTEAQSKSNPRSRFESVLVWDAAAPCVVCRGRVGEHEHGRAFPRACRRCRRLVCPRCVSIRGGAHECVLPRKKHRATGDLFDGAR